MAVRLLRTAEYGIFRQVPQMLAVAAHVGIAGFNYSALGIAVVDAIVTVAINTVRVVEAKVLVGIHPFGRSILKPLGASIPAIVLVVAVGPLVGDSKLGSVGLLAFAGLLYVGYLLRLGIDAEERIVWASLRKKMKKSDR